MSIYTVIMPVYNVEKYLERSIGSIINQECDDWELILVNDGSTDSSGKICDGYSKVDERIKVIHQENSGSGVARATALKEAQGEYICCVDPDDYLSTKALDENLSIISKFYPDVIVNGMNLVTIDSQENYEIETHLPKLNGLYEQREFREVFSDFEQAGSRTLCNKLYKKSFLVENQIMFPNQRLGQDALFNYEVYSKVNTVYIEPIAYYNYDISREGSAVKTYREDRAEYELNIANAYYLMFETWGMIDKYKKNILLAYWNVIFVELRNLSFAGNKLRISNKIKSLKDVHNMDKVLKSIRELRVTDFENLFRSLLFILIKYSNYWLAYQLMRFRLTLNKRPNKKSHLK